jgi:hypothetical protein
MNPFNIRESLFKPSQEAVAFIDDILPEILFRRPFLKVIKIGQGAGIDDASQAGLNRAAVEDRRQALAQGFDDVGIGDNFGHMVPFPCGHGKSIGCPGGGESSGFLGSQR